GGIAERGVQHGAILGRVDVLARQHRAEALGDARLLRKVNERREDLVGDEVLREVDVQIGEAQRESLGASGILIEPRAKVGREAVAELEQLVPGRGLGGIHGRGHASNLPARQTSPEAGRKHPYMTVYDAARDAT